MVVSCWVKGCMNRADGLTKRGFFSIPVIREKEGDFTKQLTDDRRRQWLANINRKDAPTKYSRICSDHFVNGKPSSMYERSNPDWAPTLKLGDILTPKKSEKKLRKLETAEKRFNRAQERQKTKEKHHIAKALLDLYDQPPEPEFIATPLVVKPSCSFLLMGKTEKLESPPSKIDPVSDSQVESEYQRMLTENVVLRTQVNDTVLSQASLEKNKEKVKYYTGLPDYLTLMTVFNFIAPFIPKPRLLELGAFERVLMTLMKLKLNLPVQDLAYRFQTSASTVSRTFIIIVHVMYVRLKHLIYWPEREELQLTMPLEFRQHFAKKNCSYH